MTQELTLIEKLERMEQNDALRALLSRQDCRDLLKAVETVRAFERAKESIDDVLSYAKTCLNQVINKRAGGIEEPGVYGFRSTNGVDREPLRTVFSTKDREALIEQLLVEEHRAEFAEKKVEAQKLEIRRLTDKIQTLQNEVE
jgi:hypothetical protein